jgi:predicted membrane protein
MEVKHRGECSSKGKCNSLLIAAIFIAVGAILIGRNLGLIEYGIYRILLSWQMLLIVIGLSIVRRQTTGGIVLIGVGSFFLIPHFTNLGYNWLGTYWPLVFVFVGIVMIVKMIAGRGAQDSWHKGEMFKADAEYTTDEGFVTSDISFGSVRQIVLAPVFKGAKISNRFGGTILDLRHTTLEAPETYIDVDCSFGGVEIYVSDSWMVKVTTQNFFGGTEDKRYKSIEFTDTTKKLIVRGHISFGGLEIKN